VLPQRPPALGTRLAVDAANFSELQSFARYLDITALLDAMRAIKARILLGRGCPKLAAERVGQADFQRIGGDVSKIRHGGAP
jgi:hypothetical protein